MVGLGFPYLGNAFILRCQKYCKSSPLLDLLVASEWSGVNQGLDPIIPSPIIMTRVSLF